MLHSFFWVIPRRLNFCADVSEHSMFRLHKFASRTFFLRTPPMKMDQRVYLNVGTYNSDAGESPKIKNTKYMLSYNVTIIFQYFGCERELLQY